MIKNKKQYFNVLKKESEILNVFKANIKLNVHCLLLDGKGIKHG